MDPASAIIGIASGAAGLAAITAHIVTYLAGLKDVHRNARLIALDLASTCRAYELAWARIQDWAEVVDISGTAEAASAFIDELQRFLKDGEIILSLIKEDLHRLSSSPQLSWWRSNASLTKKETASLMLHQKIVREHSERLNRQNNNLNLIISTMSL